MSESKKDQIMKNNVILTFALIIFSAFTFKAQAQLSVGAGLAFGTEIANIGITAKGHYGINEIWEGAASFTFFLTGEDAPGVDLNVWEFNADAHYLVSNNDKFSFYPLAGLSLAGVSIDFNTGIPGFDGKTSATEVGLNIGAGGELKFSDSLSGVAEIKYVIGGFDQLVANVGVLFALGGGN